MPIAPPSPQSHGEARSRRKRSAPIPLGCGRPRDPLPKPGETRQIPVDFGQYLAETSPRLGEPNVDLAGPNQSAMLRHVRSNVFPEGVMRPETLAPSLVKLGRTGAQSPKLVDTALRHVHLHATRRFSSTQHRPSHRAVTSVHLTWHGVQPPYRLLSRSMRMHKIG